MLGTPAATMLNMSEGSGCEARSTQRHGDVMMAHACVKKRARPFGDTGGALGQSGRGTARPSGCSKKCDRKGLMQSSSTPNRSGRTNWLVTTVKGYSTGTRPWCLTRPASSACTRWAETIGSRLIGCERTATSIAFSGFIEGVNTRSGFKSSWDRITPDDGRILS